MTNAPGTLFHVKTTCAPATCVPLIGLIRVGAGRTTSPEPGSALERQGLPRSWEDRMGVGRNSAAVLCLRLRLSPGTLRDTHLPNVKQVVEQVAQRAAYHQVIKTVNEYGMMVESETVTPSGEIQVVVRTF